MVERKEVEDLLAYVEMKLESDKVELPPSVSDATLAALCRAWLALEEAEICTVVSSSWHEWAVTHDVSPELVGQRVRIVKEVGDD